ncbi:MAG: LysR family transcriptional regulator [Pigmentiphaga sp.]|nr:LysR family transcriptional regulator [Pigmentiphaga sp.]
MQIDFLGMQAFLSIVEQGGFLQAGAHLHLSQTAISHRLRKLEESLGVKLLVRTTRQITLTDAGRALLPGVRQAVRALEDSCELLRRQGETAPEWLAFGCLPTLAPNRIAPALRTFSERCPRIAVRVFDDTVNEIAQHVESGAAAFGISIAGARRPQLAAQVFAHEAFVVACAKGHRLADRARIRWADLHGEVLIRISLPAGNAATIDDVLGRRRTDFQWEYEVQHTALALDLVAAGLGITVVPALSVSRMAGVVARPLEAPAITRSLTIITHPGRELPATARLLCELVVDEIRAQLARLPDGVAEAHGADHDASAGTAPHAG